MNCFLSKDTQQIPHPKIQTSLQQLVHSHSRQAAAGHQEAGERLVGSQVFFYWQIYGRNTALGRLLHAYDSFHQ